jgi:hypothetical protein
MFKRSVEGDNQFNKGVTWAIVFFMVFFILSQIHWLSRGLEKFDAVYIIPVFQCFFIGVSVIGGGVYFREFDDQTALQFAMFLVGLFVLLVGVYMLSLRDMSKLKPAQRFRARAHVIIFVSRTKKIVTEKQFALERDLRTIQAEEAAKAAMEMIEQEAEDRRMREDREMKAGAGADPSTLGEAELSKNSDGAVTPKGEAAQLNKKELSPVGIKKELSSGGGSLDNSESEREKRMYQRMERKSFDKIAEGRKERLSEVEKTKQNLKQRQPFGGKSVALPIQVVSQSVAATTAEINEQLSRAATEITKKSGRRGFHVAPHDGVDGGGGSAGSSRGGSNASSAEGSRATTPRNEMGGGRSLDIEAATAAVANAQKSLKTKGGDLEASPKGSFEIKDPTVGNKKEAPQGTTKKNRVFPLLTEESGSDVKNEE